jgi:hypothetical protein
VFFEVVAFLGLWFFISFVVVAFVLHGLRRDLEHLRKNYVDLRRDVVRMSHETHKG